MRGSIICSWPWWTDPLTPPLPMKLMKNLLQRALMDKVTRIRSPWTLVNRKGSGRGQWTRSFSFIKIWLVHFQVFSILFQNNFGYLVSHILRFWGILVSWGKNSGYIGIPLPTFFSPTNNVYVTWNPCCYHEKCSCHGLRVVATAFVLSGSLFCYFSVVCYE